MVFAACWSVAQQSFLVVQAPFLTEHSEAAHRNELFALQFAIQNVTNVAAAVLGGVGAVAIAGALGLDPDGPGTYRVILASWSCSWRHWRRLPCLPTTGRTAWPVRA